eukprot:scaffold501_cov355-Pinguiococcus_pyrenoidosus.AAC.2
MGRKRREEYADRVNVEKLRRQWKRQQGRSLIGYNLESNVVIGLALSIIQTTRLRNCDSVVRPWNGRTSIAGCIWADASLREDTRRPSAVELPIPQGTPLKKSIARPFHQRESLDSRAKLRAKCREWQLRPGPAISPPACIPASAPSWEETGKPPAIPRRCEA